MAVAGLLPAYVPPPVEDEIAFVVIDDIHQRVVIEVAAGNEVEVLPQTMPVETVSGDFVDEATRLVLRYLRTSSPPRVRLPSRNETL